MSRLNQLSRFGQSVWIDYISRRLLTDGGLQRLIMEEGLRGLTSNPAIFGKAIAGGKDYREALIDAVRRGERGGIARQPAWGNCRDFVMTAHQVSLAIGISENLMQLLRRPGGKMKTTRNWCRQPLTQVKLNFPLAVNINSDAYRPEVEAVGCLCLRCRMFTHSCRSGSPARID